MKKIFIFTSLSFLFIQGAIAQSVTEPDSRFSLSAGAAATYGIGAQKNLGLVSGIDIQLLDKKTGLMIPYRLLINTKSLYVESGLAYNTQLQKHIDLNFLALLSNLHLTENEKNYLRVRLAAEVAVQLKSRITLNARFDQDLNSLFNTPTVNGVPDQNPYQMGASLGLRVRLF